MTRILIAFLALVVCPSAAASAVLPPEVATLVRQAAARNLAHHPYWIALMHYRPDARNPDTVLGSDIISPDFFLSPDGATDSGSELAATLAAFFNDPGNAPDSHAQCRFVARYKWLRKSLDWSGSEPPSVPCKQFDAWTMNGQVESLSVVFATGYFSNPASFYGHILLKFNTNRTVSPTAFLDESLNYGAIVPAGENGFVYVFNGLFGGYDASFSNTRFYRLNHMYAESELRDMWEYELALDKDEVDQIAAHSWELLSARFTYYFLKENCAYRMAELLELAVGQELLARDAPWALPVNVFNRLVSVERNGVPLVRKARLIPSRLNSFYAKYSALNAGQRTLVTDLVGEAGNFGAFPYSGLAEADKIPIVDTLLDYYEFRIVSDEKNPALRKRKQQALIERTSLASQDTHAAGDTPNMPDTSPPHEGPPPGMVRLGQVRNSRFGSGIEIRLRPSYYDLLQPDTGHVPNSNLTMFDFRAIYADSSLSLRNAEFVNIETLNVSRTGLPGDGGQAWKVKFGFSNQDLNCQSCMVFNVTGGIGKAAPITSNSTLYGMVDLFVQTRYLDSGTIGVTPTIGLIASPSGWWKSNITLGQRMYANGAMSGNRTIHWENRIGSQRDWDIRISYEEQVAREFQVAFSAYW